ncbi:MAG: M20/M25/M40 family metallo-hydrolase [Candidatus Levybacteria bacterium]|nr:M20/M25/M40 family metallo-hydrolase [Candidatus Levybacteria bacterium]
MIDTITKLTQKLVGIRSDYPNESPAGIFLVDVLKDLGFKVEFQYPKDTKKRFNILATRGSGKRSILFYGHQDTVPLIDERLWTYKPLSGKIVGDKLYGLGAYDMKGGIAAFLQAVRHTSGYIKVLLPFDEENISEGAWLAVQKRKDFFSDVELVISPEPNFGLGINNIPTSRPGRSVYEVNLHADAAHVAEYAHGKDAVLELAVFITAFHKKFHDTSHPFFTSQYSLTMIRRVFSESVGITAPSTATIQIEVYVDKNDNEEKFIAAVKKIANVSINLISRKTPYLKAYRFYDFPHKNLIKQIIRKHTGKSFTNDTYSAVGDDNVIASLGIPVLTWGPDGGNAHVENEYVNLSSLRTLSAMFIDLLQNVEGQSLL